MMNLLCGLIHRKQIFQAIIKESGLLPQVRLYDLRHTTANLFLSADENPKIVSECLGHASVVMTLDTYSHFLPTMQETGTKKLEKITFGI